MTDDQALFATLNSRKAVDFIMFTYDSFLDQICVLLKFLAHNYIEQRKTKREFNSANLTKLVRIFHKMICKSKKFFFPHYNQKLFPINFVLLIQTLYLYSNFILFLSQREVITNFKPLKMLCLYLLIFLHANYREYFGW